MKTILTCFFALNLQFLAYSQEPLLDICKQDCYSYPNLLFRTDSTVFFSAYNTETNFELWKSDGTKSGTVMVKDLTPGSYGTSFNQNYYNDNGKFYFMTRVASHFYRLQLWVTDGTESGTIMLKLSHSISGSLDAPGQIIRFKDKIYFISSDSTNGVALWTTDGTVEGTTLFKTLEDESNDARTLYNMFVKDDKLYFFANTKLYGNELWVSDGTAEGTKLFIDFVPGQLSGVGLGGQSFFFKNHLYFYGRRVNNSIHGMMRSDFTFEGTKYMDSINFPALRATASGSNYQDDSVIIFNCYNNNTGELWLSDGTETGFKQIKMDSMEVNYAYLNNKGVRIDDNLLVYTYTDLYHYEPMLINLKTGVMKLVLDIAPGNNSSLLNTSIIEKNGRYYFLAIHPSLNVDVWRIDPNDNWRTILFKEYAENSNLMNIFEINDKQFLIGNLNSMYGIEIYKFDELILGIDEVKNEKLSAYPNPIQAGQILNLKDVNGAYLELLDMQGKRLDDVVVSDNYQVPSFISPGIYIIRLTIENAVRTMTISIH